MEAKAAHHLLNHVQHTNDLLGDLVWKTEDVCVILEKSMGTVSLLSMSLRLGSAYAIKCCIASLCHRCCQVTMPSPTQPGCIDLLLWKIHIGR